MLQKYKEGDLIYWSNCVGELHHNGEYDIADPKDLPKELQHAYKELFSDYYGVRCYLAEYRGNYGIGYIAEYSEYTAKAFDMSYDQLIKLAKERAEIIAETLKAIEGCEVCFGEITVSSDEGEKLSELLVFIPWTESTVTSAILGCYLTEWSYSLNESKEEITPKVLSFVSRIASLEEFDEYDVFLALGEIGITLEDFKGTENYEYARKFTETHAWEAAENIVITSENKNIPVEYLDDFLGKPVKVNEKEGKITKVLGSAFEITFFDTSEDKVIIDIADVANHLITKKTYHNARNIAGHDLSVSAEQIKTDKKINMAYFDIIDYLIREHVGNCLLDLMYCSTKDIDITDENIAEISKTVGDSILTCLEDICGAEFPYVNEDA